MSEQRGRARKLSGSTASKWSLVGNSIVGATDPVTFEDVDEVVTQAADNFGVNLIRVYTGIHGTPSGIIQIDEPDFTEKDTQELEQDEDDLKIEVVSMTDIIDIFEQSRIPDQLKADLDDPDVFVVLAWCYSKFFLDFQKYQPAAD